jgi:UDP-N-acetylglucosamine diphosphorylase / glucose-1-phosphate thymidylyltransferase / UDP-N-acetylgalactosamine diphosphorylase / glucosamine-1-phosphate N-acetyltransferase / galactosamine-1-phosphate N-acetyltransferase
MDTLIEAGGRAISLCRHARFLYFAGMLFKADDLFDLSQTEHAALFEGCNYAWEALKKIKPYLAKIPRQNPPRRFPGATIGDRVVIGEGTVVEPGAMIIGPAIIGKNCQIRHNAYLREDVIIGDDCVVGNASELKNAFFFNGARAPHYNYVGDSILGHKAHLGAGVKISNIKLLPGNVTVELDGVPTDTGLRKFGALLGDGAEAGCNAVLNPGSILGRGAIIYPNVFWRGILPANMIAKNRAEIEVAVKRPREA